MNSSVAAPDSTSSPRSAPRRSRTVLAVVAILLGVLLTPTAVVAGWAKWTLTDTDRFVATYAPLAQDPAVQQYVTDEVMTVMEQRIDFEATTQQLVDGIIKLGLGPRAAAALQTLQGSLVAGLRAQVRDGINEFVSSERFADAWSEALRISHQQLLATMSNDPDAIAQVSSDGTLSIPLQPIVEKIKARLVEQGVTVASRIPPVDRSIVVLKSADLPLIQAAFAATIAIGTWLPWVTLALLAAGVIVANNRSKALIWAAIGFTVATGVLAAGVAAGRVVIPPIILPPSLPLPVGTALYNSVTALIQTTAIAAAVLGAAIAIIGWLAGPFSLPTHLRALYLGEVDRVRTAAATRGLSTGKVGAWIHRRRKLLFALIAVVAAAVILTNLPVTTSLVGWTAFWSIIAVVVLTLVERPDATSPDTESTVQDADRVSGSVEQSGQ